MGAVVQFYQTYGPSPGTDVPQGMGSGSNDWDFKRTDEPGPITNPSDQGIFAGNPSMDVYIKAKFNQPSDGSPYWTSIDNVVFYASVLDLTGCGAGAYILASGTNIYNQPSDISKLGSWDIVPTSAVSGINIGTPNLAAGIAGWTNWVGLQLKTTVSDAIAGYSSYNSFTICYDEI
jgi:hypothetical protein